MLILTMLRLPSSCEADEFDKAEYLSLADPFNGDFNGFVGTGGNSL